MTWVKRGVAVLAGVGAVAMFTYTQFRDVDWYDDSAAPALIQNETPPAP
jgi:hypothetical protein